MDLLEKFIDQNPRLSSKRKDLLDGEQLLVYKDGSPNVYFDAILHLGSYGHENNLLEIMGDIVKDTEDSVKGWLTANDIIAMITEDLEGKRKKKRIIIITQRPKRYDIRRQASNSIKKILKRRLTFFFFYGILYLS